MRGEKPSQIRLYNLRKYFRRQAYQAGSDFCNFWMGHVTKNVDLQSYFPKDDVEFHRKRYETDALPHLKIFEETPTEMQQIIQKCEARMRKMEEEHRRELAEVKGKVQNQQEWIAPSGVQNFSRDDWQNIRDLTNLAKYYTKSTPTRKKRLTELLGAILEEDES